MRKNRENGLSALEFAAYLGLIFFLCMVFANLIQPTNQTNNKQTTVEFAETKTTVQVGLQNPRYTTFVIEIDVPYWKDISIPSNKKAATYNIIGKTFFTRLDEETAKLLDSHPACNFVRTDFLSLKFYHEYLGNEGAVVQLPSIARVVLDCNK